MSDRPGWCPHKDCIFKAQRQNVLCGGWLPKPADHGEFKEVNDRRMCMKAFDDSKVIDWQVNASDLWNLETFSKWLRESKKEEP